VITLDGQVLNQEFINSLIGFVGTLTTAITSLIGSILNLFVTVLLSLFLSLLVLFDFRNTRKGVVMRVSPAYHREVAILLKRIVDIWNGFLKGQVMLAMLVGVVTYLQLMLMGVQGALLMALVTAVISIIPTIGGIIALIPMFFVPLLSGSTVFPDLSPVTFALLVVGVNLIITQIIWNAVAPAIMGDALNLPMVVIILGVFVGAAVGGVLGAFLVAPVMSMLRTISEYFMAKIGGQDPYPQEEGEIASQWEIERMRMRDQMKQERRRKQQKASS
jgi:predicted PurR-regulated permease PerM